MGSCQLIVPSCHLRNAVSGTMRQIPTPEPNLSRLGTKHSTLAQSVQPLDTFDTRLTNYRQENRLGIWATRLLVPEALAQGEGEQKPRFSE